MNMCREREDRVHAHPFSNAQWTAARSAFEAAGLELAAIGEDVPGYRGVAPHAWVVAGRVVIEAVVPALYAEPRHRAVYVHGPGRQPSGGTLRDAVDEAVADAMELARSYAVEAAMVAAVELLSAVDDLVAGHSHDDARGCPVCRAARQSARAFVRARMRLDEVAGGEQR